MSDFVLDASLALQWFLEDETGRQYSLSILASLSTKRAAVPILWFYEVGNGLLMAYRRKRITFTQIDGFLTRLKALPIDADQQVPTEILELPAIAQRHNLTNYDSAYLALAMRLQLPLATTDADLRRASHCRRRRDHAGVGKRPGLLSVPKSSFAEPEGYVQLIKLLHSSPWFKSPRPRDPKEAAVWRRRVALFMDGIFWAPKKA